MASRATSSRKPENKVANMKIGSGATATANIKLEYKQVPAKAQLR